MTFTGGYDPSGLQFWGYPVDMDVSTPGEYGPMFISVKRSWFHDVDCAVYVMDQLTPGSAVEISGNLFDRHSWFRPDSRLVKGNFYNLIAIAIATTLVGNDVYILIESNQLPNWIPDRTIRLNAGILIGHQNELTVVGNNTQIIVRNNYVISTFYLETVLLGNGAPSCFTSHGLPDGAPWVDDQRDWEHVWGLRPHPHRLAEFRVARDQSDKTTPPAELIIKNNSMPSTRLTSNEEEDMSPKAYLDYAIDMAPSLTFLETDNAYGMWGSTYLPPSSEGGTIVIEGNDMPDYFHAVRLQFPEQNNYNFTCTTPYLLKIKNNLFGGARLAFPITLVGVGTSEMRGSHYSIESNAYSVTAASLVRVDGDSVVLHRSSLHIIHNQAINGTLNAGSLSRLLALGGDVGVSSRPSWNTSASLASTRTPRAQSSRRRCLDVDALESMHFSSGANT